MIPPLDTTPTWQVYYVVLTDFGYLISFVLLVYIVKYSGVCPILPALDYKQQTTFQNISQGHGQMKLPDIAEERYESDVIIMGQN